MNKFSVIIFVCFGFCLDISGQAVPKKIIVEHFTNTKCSICASRNPGFYVALAQKPEVIHIAYHPSAPYNTCLFSTQNKVENDARTNYYDLYGGTPTFVINGVEKSSTAVQSTNVYTPFQNLTSPLSINVALFPSNQDSIGVQVLVTSVAEHSLTNVTLYLPLVEDSVWYNAPNGEKVHHDVFRKSFTGSDPINFIAPKEVGKTFTYTAKIGKKDIWNVQRLSAVAIISDKVDNVVQAEQSPLYTESVSSASDMNEADFGMTVFPNPTTHFIQITSKSNKTIGDIQIINQKGEIVMTRKNIDTSSVIDVSTLPLGCYFIMSLGQSKVSSVTFIKQ